MRFKKRFGIMSFENGLQTYLKCVLKRCIEIRRSFGSGRLETWGQVSWNVGASLLRLGGKSHETWGKSHETCPVFNNEPSLPDSHWRQVPSSKLQVPSSKFQLPGSMPGSTFQVGALRLEKTSCLKLEVTSWMLRNRVGGLRAGAWYFGSKICFGKYVVNTLLGNFFWKIACC